MTDRDEQKRQIYNVLDYIKKNLECDLSLDKLAEVSTYSPYHFHRLFTDIMGETPSDYVKRIRMEEAAHLLIYEPNRSVTDIAMACGFSTLSYFTYAFKAYYQHSPKVWREGAYLEKFPRAYLDSKKSKQQSTNPKETENNNVYNEFQWVDLSRVKVERLPERQLAYLQHIGSYTDTIEQTWEKVYQFSETRDLITDDTTWIGIPHNNPYLTPSDRCRYDCCIALPKEAEITAPIKSTQLAEGKYVFYELEEPISFNERNFLIECYSELYSYWLPKKGYKCLSSPIEIIQIKPSGGAFDIHPKIIKIGLPIQPK
ncbi:AraC family transcriptional regulator [Pseudalkalibacillus sp. SCS-8]|uniref:AraC family transcriptional regulator n=1 Tax=Pseudalkalibacillus nanhaiensis TaxID=3115291 RepID=UPI0032DAC96D